MKEKTAELTKTLHIVFVSTFENCDFKVV